jgi:hypothetical protein
LVQNGRGKMPQYEGFVASLKGNGRAEVIIGPGKPCIPGAPEVSEKACHCPTDSSNVTIEALNRAGARPGDLVSVWRSPAALLKNAAILLGIPTIGLISGIVAGVILDQGFAVHTSGAVLVVAGLLLGIIVAVLRYRRVSADNLPVITRIIKTRLEMAASSNGN